MPIDILMPELSPSMEKGTLVQWTRAVGDKVRTGETIAEVETDKTTVDVVADADGVLSAIFVTNGTSDVPVHVVIGRIAVDGEAQELAPPAQDTPIETCKAQDDDVVAPSETQPLDDKRLPERIFSSPIARRLMAEANIDARSLTGSGPNTRILNVTSLRQSPSASNEVNQPREN